MDIQIIANLDTFQYLTFINRLGNKFNLTFDISSLFVLPFLISRNALLFFNVFLYYFFTDLAQIISRKSLKETAEPQPSCCYQSFLSFFQLFFSFHPTFFCIQIFIPHNIMGGQPTSLLLLLSLVQYVMADDTCLSRGQLFGVIFGSVAAAFLISAALAIILYIWYRRSSEFYILLCILK